MSDVEKMYAAMCAKWVENVPGSTPKPAWNQLQPGHQIALIQAFNTIIMVMEQA